MNLRDLYLTARSNGPGGEVARQLLAQTHWFTTNAEFDPKTGDALPQALSVFLAKVANPKTNDRIHDRLYRITEHARPSLDRLFRNLKESPRREHAILPVRAVRELDAGSFIKLSARPGRNIREKLSGKPYLQAVRRYQSVNLPENRLLKAFASRLSKLLELRRDILGEPEDDLLIEIRSWLCTDEARTIGGWDNPPPNNTLLAHRDYRRVWDSWRRLQCLDDDIALDMNRLDTRRNTMMYWDNYGRMYRDGNHLFAEMPVLFGYEDFTIRGWRHDPYVIRSSRKIVRFDKGSTIETVACLDLSVARPCYSDESEVSCSLAESYVWQQWNNADETVDVALFTSDAVCLDPDSRTITSQDVIFTSNMISDDLLERAARSFACRLRETFKNDRLIWLVPDALNDFDLELVRRNLNAKFPGAEPLPRSIAAIFGQIDHANISHDGYTVVIVDDVGGIICATRMVARFDAELLTSLPMTNGYYWERCPPIILSTGVTGNERRYGIVTVDGDGKWRHNNDTERPLFADVKELRNDKRIGQFAKVLTCSTSPVSGGMRLHFLQARAGEIPLWRDQIPELSIKGYIDGFFRRFTLVSRGQTVRPIRGISGGQRLPIGQLFKLPAKHHSCVEKGYSFPLFIGENANQLGYSAHLDSPAFPLKSDTECDLILTFQYGDDEPYSLVFAPIDRSFPPVRATWRRTIENLTSDAPAPEYPAPLSWDDLRHWRDPQGLEVDLLAWLVDSLKRLVELIPRRHKITINSSWKMKADDKGTKYWFAFASSDDGDNCYCNTRQFNMPYGEDVNKQYPRGTVLYGNIRQTPGGFQAFDISDREALIFSSEARRRLISFKERSLLNRMSTIWADGRSVTDIGCPNEFRQDINSLISELLENLPADLIDRKMMSLLACLHKDAIEQCIKWVTNQVRNGRIRDPRPIGLSLGDVSMEWQKKLFEALASDIGNDAIGVFSYAIWRNMNFINQFSSAKLITLLNALSRRLDDICSVTVGEFEEISTLKDWTKATSETFELLLGILRTRASSQPEIARILQPQQKIVKVFSAQIDRIEEILSESHITLSSRVRIHIQKPEGVRTPDLLFALRLYFTGDDGAGAIHITGITDTDDD